MTKKVQEVLFFAGLSVLAILGIVIGRKYLIKPSAENDNNSTPIEPKKSSNNILFVGDSITAEFYNGLPTYTYSYILKHTTFKDKAVDILAIGGKQTSWMLSNLPTQLAKKKYDKVFIYGGINDVFSAVTAVKATSNIQKMVDLVIANGAKAYVIVGYDTAKFTPDSKLKATNYVTQAGMVILRNNYITYQKYLKNNIKNATVVPEFELSSSMNVDGIHINGTGHKIIANIISEYIS